MRAAAHQARYEIRRVGEETVTASRLLAGRPTLARLVREANAVQLQLFLRRFCETAGLDACALFNGTQLVVSAGETTDWPAVLEAADEQGESFMVASRVRGPLGALASIPGFQDGRVVAIRELDDHLAAELSRQVNAEIQLVPITAWLDSVDADFRDVHSEALATGSIAVAEIVPRSEFAASLPVFASTGEAILLIQARLPATAGAGAVSSFVRRLALVSILLAGVALLASLLLARRIGAPIQALANYAERLGQVVNDLPRAPLARRLPRLQLRVGNRLQCRRYGREAILVLIDQVLTLRRVHPFPSARRVLLAVLHPPFRELDAASRRVPGASPRLARAASTLARSAAIRSTTVPLTSSASSGSTS